jgi:hypothetical protein
MAASSGRSLLELVCPGRRGALATSGPVLCHFHTCRAPLAEVSLCLPPWAVFFGAPVKETNSAPVSTVAVQGRDAGFFGPFAAG